ncbi:Mob1/phocein [Coemansia reversa NRRL 1564]|uniref:Mob1/phocein n=1 Tax=Coemansia reversa (strain ATCC 12441 / NRRL 1564) TaxID=763665 RepID=A0A2G5B2K3_COERN|nr:Mob1/phocein [Coemansia reversa NRRL 1564]|eukprot:PIA13248.1 Mob1/phocein [Coemansia reversa NRRL 1564]
MTAAISTKASEQQRINLPGTREEDCFWWKYDKVSEVGTEMAGQEYLQGLLRQQRRFEIEKLLQVPSGIGRLSWLYEHMRQICVELGYYLAQLYRECTERDCPIMRANDTTFYCAGHGNPRPCSAMGYSVHTLDYAVRLLSSGTTFPDRSLIQDSCMKHFQSMVRRLYRIFAHTYFHHREFFERQESATYLYARFVRLARKYELAPESQIIIPDLPTTIEPPTVAK